MTSTEANLSPCPNGNVHCIASGDCRCKGIAPPVRVDPDLIDTGKSVSPQHWPGEPSAAEMMDDLWNALHDSEHGHPADPSPQRVCWEAMLARVRKIRQDRWNLWHETGRVSTDA